MNKSSSPIVFDRPSLRRHIARATLHFAQHSALFDDCATQINDRLADVNHTFPRALDLSPFPFLQHANTTSFSTALPETETLPFHENDFDLIASNLDLHWVNDLPGILTQLHAILKSDGMFIATLIGGDSLHELRSCLMDAEITITGGVSPRLSPTLDLQTASVLMQRAGFTLPVADKETITLLYPDMFALMRDLRGMGQTNVHTERIRRCSRRAVFFEAARLYHDRFADAQTNIPATFEILHLHGWK